MGETPLILSRASRTSLMWASSLGMLASPPKLSMVACGLSVDHIWPGPTGRLVKSSMPRPRYMRKQVMVTRLARSERRVFNSSCKPIRGSTSPRPTSTAARNAALRVPAAGSSEFSNRTKGTTPRRFSPFFRQHAAHVALPMGFAKEVEGKFRRGFGRHTGEQRRPCEPAAHTPFKSPPPLPRPTAPVRPSSFAADDGFGTTRHKPAHLPSPGDGAPIGFAQHSPAGGSGQTRVASSTSQGKPACYTPRFGTGDSGGLPDCQNCRPRSGPTGLPERRVSNSAVGRTCSHAVPQMAPCNTMRCIRANPPPSLCSPICSSASITAVSFARCAGSRAVEGDVGHSPRDKIDQRVHPPRDVVFDHDFLALHIHHAGGNVAAAGGAAESGDPRKGVPTPDIGERVAWKNWRWRGRGVPPKARWWGCGNIPKTAPAAA